MQAAVIAVTLCLTAGVWIAFHFYNTYDRHLVLDMYMGRQRTIMNYTGDLLDIALEYLQGVNVLGMSVGDYATNIIDDYISSGAITKDLEKRILDANKPGPGESLAYGNFILVYKGRTRYVIGYLESEFTRNSGSLSPRNRELRRLLDRHRRAVDKTPGRKGQFSEVARVAGRPAMFTTGALVIGENTAYLTMYAEQEKILRHYEHYDRQRMALLCAALVTAGILAFAIVALRGLRGSMRHYHSVRAYNIALENEIRERGIAQRQKDALQEQLLHSQKMEAIGTMAGGIAHDFNNLLTVIMGNAEIALMNLLPGEAPHHELRQIYKASQRARDLTMKMLTFARKEKLSERTLPLNTIIERELLPMIERSMPPSVRVSTILKRDLDPVRGDVNQLLQAFINICTNARDAMDGAGTLTIETGEVTVAPGETGPAGLPAGRWCFARFTDDGPGMTPEVLNKVCEPFFTTKPMGRGTGLGMAVTHGIITGHGGRLALASPPGRGASVTVYLPFAGTGPAAANAQPPAAVAQTRPAALIVDDEPEVLDFVAEVLGEKDCDVLTAKNGEGALALFRDNGPRIALAVIDRHLPDMQGADLALKIKQQFPRCGVIIMSGDNAPAPEPAAAVPLAPVFLNKPFLIDELLSLASPFLDNA